MRSAESHVEKKEPEFKVDLRIEGIAQDVILEDEERMGKVQVIVHNFRNGSRTESIIEDLGRPEKSIKFCEESSGTIHELGNIEAYELGQISRTVQCHSWLKHLPEGLIFCACGIWLRLDEKTNRKNHSQIPGYESPLVHCTS